MTKLTLVAIAALLALAGCGAAPDYAAEHKAATDAFLAAWNSGAVDGLDAVTSKDIKRRSPGGLDTDGLGAYKKIVLGMRTSYPDLKLVVDDGHYMKDVAYFQWTFIGTNSGPGGMPPTGKSVKLMGVTRVKYQDDKVVDERVFFDTLDWNQQLGFTLTPPASAQPAAAAAAPAAKKK